MSIHYANNVRNAVHPPHPDHGDSERWHRAALGDTGTSHTLPGRLYIVQCEWCPEAFAAHTKAEAMTMFREHEENPTDPEWLAARDRENRAIGWDAGYLHAYTVGVQEGATGQVVEYVAPNPYRGDNR